MASMFLCGVFAVLSGLVMAIGMNILAWVTRTKDKLTREWVVVEESNPLRPDEEFSAVKVGGHGAILREGKLVLIKLVEAQRGTPHDTTPLLWLVVNLVFQLASVGCFVYACSWGPVALAMPLETATLLLSNLALQVLLGIVQFDKECFAATLVLTCAACCLGDVGPVDKTPADAKNDTALDLLLETTSISWIAFVFLLGLISYVMMKACEPNSLRQALGYSLFVAVATAVGATIGKFLTFTTTWLFGTFFVVYALSGVGSLLYGAFAATSCDLVFFMASNECFKLILTAFTGRFIWKDTPSHWLSYVMVYILMCLGAYIVYLGEVGKQNTLQSLREPLTANSRY